jgi:hypothetical protein
MKKDNKIGRNNPCWCKSGKKFKHCHLDRDKAEKLTRSDLEAHRKEVGALAKCLVKDLYKNECSSRIVRAHTISKSGSLKQIAVDGHVMGTRPNLSQLIQNNGKLTLVRVGINNASTFTGFCSHHDKNLFAPLEDFPITLSNEQLFLLAYRSISRELFAKESNTKAADLMRQADRGFGEPEQFLIQNGAAGFAGGVELALKELNHIKREMDNMLISSDFSKLNHFVVEFSSRPSVLVSASTQPEFDFTGNRLQSFGAATEPMSHIIFNCISYGDTGCFVFSWIDAHSDVCQKFIDTLANLGESEIGNALIRFSYSFAENTWASPQWWEALNDTAKVDISERLQHGLSIPHTAACLASKGINFDAYKVASFGYRKH